VSNTFDETVRFSLVQLDDYGPWTVTPAPRRETDLQALQARIYADFADFVGRSDGYAFYNRFDNMLGVVNDISPEEFARFQERIRNRYPVTASVGIGEATTPVEAVRRASEQLQQAGSAQDSNRREALRYGGVSGTTTSPHMTVAHFDIIDVTGTYTDDTNAVDTELAIRDSAMTLRKHLRSEHDSVAQFVGGDNVIAVCPQLSYDTFETILEHVSAEAGVEYQVGIGRGQTAHDAGSDAKHALEVCRESGISAYEVDSTDHTADDETDSMKSGHGRDTVESEWVGE